MGAFDSFIQSIKSGIPGVIPYGGTIVPTSNEFSTMLAQTIRGGYMALPDLETLADLPIEMMQKDMTIVVGEHARPNGSLHTRTKYYLKVVPSDRISILGDDLSLYWIVEDTSTAENSDDVEVEYAPNFEGKRPRFLPIEISSVAYQAGYPTTELFQAGNPSDIIWVSTFDATKNHAWYRQRIGAQPWGAPVSISAGGDYEKNQYIDVIFRWVTKGSGVPPKPVQPNDFNVLPTGWDNTPGDDYVTKILTQDLYRSEALRNPYGVVKSDWTIPILVSSDPNLVRYGNTPGSTDFLNNTFWRGYFTPGLDTHMATRTNGSSSDWTITKIDQESGEYSEFVFMLLPIGANEDDIIAATPTLLIPIGNAFPNNCSDAPITPTDNNSIQYVSVCVKYSDGSFKKPWSVPKRFDGLDNFIVTIDESPGDTFFKTRDSSGNLVDSFSDMVLTPHLFKGITELTSDINSVKWYRGNTLIVFDGTTHKATNLGVSLNPYHTISVDGKTLTLNPQAVDGSQQYKVGINHVTRPTADYVGTIQVFDATDDGMTFMTDVNPVNGSTFKNQTGLYRFDARFFKGGVLDNTGVTFAWSIVNAAGVTIANGLRNSSGTSVGDTNVAGTTVYIEGSDIDQSAALILTATFGQITRTYRLTLTDVQDAEGVDVLYWGTGDVDPGNPTDFEPRTLTKAQVLSLGIGYLAPENAAGAWYRIERVNGSWGAELKVKAETSNPSGGINIIIWKNVTSPTVPSAPAVPTSGSIIPAGWTTTPTAFSGGEDTTYMTSCLFLLRMDIVADPTSLTRDNYYPATTFGEPKKIQAAPAGDGTPGTNGWSPVIQTVTDGARIVLFLADWIGGTGTKPAGSGSDHSYIGDNGLTTITLARNVRGQAGADSGYKPPSFYKVGNRDEIAGIATAQSSNYQVQQLNLPAGGARLILVKGVIILASDSGGLDDLFELTIQTSTPTVAWTTLATVQCRPNLASPNGVQKGVPAEISCVIQDVNPSESRTILFTIQELSGGNGLRSAGYLEALILPQV